MSSGYDGGPFLSYDGKKVVYRAEHPKTPQEIADYKALLAQGLIRPGNLEIWVMDVDGKNKQQVTHNGAANFAPYFFPDGKRIIFASNMADPKNGRDFDLYVMNVDGASLERITFSSGLRFIPYVYVGREKACMGALTATAPPLMKQIFLLRIGLTSPLR